LLSTEAVASVGPSLPRGVRVEFGLLWIDSEPDVLESDILVF